MVKEWNYLGIRTMRENLLTVLGNLGCATGESDWRYRHGSYKRCRYDEWLVMDNARSGEHPHVQCSHVRFYHAHEGYYLLCFCDADGRDLVSCGLFGDLTLRFCNDFRGTDGLWKSLQPCRRWVSE